MHNTLSEPELEQAYDLIATAIDRVGRTDESLFLAKLCLALSAQVQSVHLIAEAIRTAEQDLEG